MPRRRGYGGNYGLDIRPIYGENEPTWGESASRGIGRFIAERQKKGEENEEWENQVRDAGGTVTPQQSTMDRLRGIGNTIRKHLPGYDPLPEAEANMARGRQPGDFMGTTSSADDPGFQRRPQRASDPGFGISQEIDRYIAHGPNGREAILPSALGRQQMATRAEIAKEARARTGKREEVAYEKGIEHQNKLEEIKATPRTASEDWYNRENVRSQNAKELKQTPGAPSTPNAASERNSRVGVLRGIISSAQATLPKNSHERRSAMRDPALKAQIEQAEADISAAREELKTLEPGVPKKAPPPSASAADSTKNAGAPIEVMKQRAAVVKADALKKFPKASPKAVAAYVRNVMRREGYNIE